MLKEIIIWPSEENKGSDKGKFFEALANKIFSTQRYKVDGNVHVTGMEFDLECIHMDRTNERCLVECKAKKSLSSDEITKFVFNKDFKRFDIGFFLYTGNYQRQVAGIIKEIESDERYKNLYFWNADKVIELLVSSSTISDFNFDSQGLDTNKVILLYSHLGVFYIPIMTAGTIPTHYSILDAKTNNIVEEKTIRDRITKHIEEVTSLEFVESQSAANIDDGIVSPQLETVAEIQSSDSWDDYKPASMKHFVGRKRQKDKLFGFLNELRKGFGEKRVFYVDGKSGWGKSSLLNDLRGRCRNKHYKNRYFSIVVDSRSANSHNFVPLTYDRLIKKAVKNGFIPEHFSCIKIPSSFEVLGDRSTIDLLDWLEDNSKYLIIVFDQFEDVFRKENIFKSFYKFLVDIGNRKGNLILGFSWKSEVNIPIENEAYHLWQQSKDHSFKITLDEFVVSESKAIIKQLEKDISEKFDIDFIRKIVDNSQGYPWLVKKLCIHIKKQVKQGLDIESLYEQDFQVERLFKDDLEELNPEEVRVLRYIANRAYKEQALDVTELDEIVSSNIVQHLIHKRYVSKSGTKYNIYWDIFRDYLVSDDIPPIGETYLIRQPVNSVLEAFLTFSISNRLTLEEFIKNVSSAVAEGAALNILRELRSLGLVNYKGNYYYLRNTDYDVSIETFRDYIFDKLQKHSFTLELKKLEGREIHLHDLTHIIETKIKTKSFANRTLETYAQIFLGWLEFAGIENLNMNPMILRRAKNVVSYTPQMYPKDVEIFLLLLDEMDWENKTKRDSKLLYDAKSLGLIRYSKDSVQLSDMGKEAVNANDYERKIIFSECAKKTEKIKYAYDVFLNNIGISSRKFKPLISQILDGLNSKVYINKTSRVLYLWSAYIHEAEKNIIG